jgi:adenine deaminase
MHYIRPNQTNVLMTNTSIADFIQNLPKCELHLHIEGSFEPELMFEIAKRNQITIPYNTVEEVKAAYQFNNLQDFLDIYYAGAQVLITEQDFYDLTWAYLQRVHKQNVLHVEIFFDPQTHTERGVEFSTVIDGIYRALLAGRDQLGISFQLIMSFLRHLDEASAFATLHAALPYRDKIIAVGLDSSELGNPPSIFERVFAKAREEGFITVAHAGEEGPVAYIWEALRLLHVSRIDHGNTCLHDQNLVDELVRRRIALTLCPLSNEKLKVVPDLRNHPVRVMLEKGLLATIHSDDPAYFGGYMNENYTALTDALNLTKAEICQLAKNSFEASFLDTDQKVHLIDLVEKYAEKYG